MTALALELDDRALALARDGAVLVSAPSAVFDGSGPGVEAGSNAWRALRRQPRSTSTRHLGALLGYSEAVVSLDRAAALVSAELALHFATHAVQEGEPLWIAVPAYAEAGGLGEMLAVAQERRLPVEGFVDAAAASVAVLKTARNALVLELGLHHAAVTSVESSGQARRRSAVVASSGGLIGLYDAWLTFISTAMVKRTRFDPFTNAETEQQLFDALPALTRQAAQSGGTTAAVSNGDTRFEVSLSRDQFAEAAQPVYRELVRLLHSLRPAGAEVSILMPEAVAALPGLREMLQQFVGCELVSLPEGFAAAATSLLDLPRTEQGEAVRLLRKVPVRRQAALAEGVTRETLGRSGVRALPPSHVLFEGRAILLGSRPLVVGRSPIGATAEGAEPPALPVAAEALALPDGLAGVSRRHCTFVRQGDDLVLVDHSHFGTFVNGERVSERVRILAGDKVRIGEPGVELSLISIGT